MTMRVVRRSPVLALFLAGLPAGAAAQVAPLPPRPAVAFPPAVFVLIGASSYGDRAGYTDSVGGRWSESLVNGPVVGGRLQSPLGRRFGLHAGGAFTYRSHRVNKDGTPQSAYNDHVGSVRLDGGLLFRFKPAAPLYFGGSVVYYHHFSPPVLTASSSATSELGWGIGLGADFGRRPGSNFFGRVEYWSYSVTPKADSLTGAFTLRSRARDGALSVGIAWLLRVHAPPAAPAR